MNTKFQFFLNENASKGIYIKEFGEILTLDLITELQSVYMDEEDINLFEKSHHIKTHFEITFNYDNIYEYEDIHQLLKGCDFIYDIYSLKCTSDYATPFWIDMGNGITSTRIRI